MITADPQRRVSTLARILDHVGRTAPDADRDLLLALAPVVYGDMPDPLALRLSPEAISARARRHLPLRRAHHAAGRSSSTRACPACTSPSATPTTPRPRADGARRTK